MLSTLLTVTFTTAEVVLLPAASRATAVSVCPPLLALVLSQVIAYGAVVSSAPRLAPSSLNCTPTTPTLSAAVAATATLAPDTVAPVLGAVIATVGGVLSTLLTVTFTTAEVVLLPAASRATAVSVCPPLLAVVLSQVIAYGEVVSSAPRLAPSSLNCTPTTPTLSAAVAATATLAPDTVAPVVGAVIATVGGVLSTLLTVTFTTAEVVLLPAASRATAVSVCPPLLALVLSQVIAYGEVVSSAPRLAPSSLNCTPATPTLSAAFAATATLAPDTVAPVVGAVIDTVGGVVSALLTVTLTAAEVAVLPAASRATAVSVCAPLVAVVLFQVIEYGAVVTSAPRLAPSSLNCTPATPTLSAAFADTVTLATFQIPLRRSREWRSKRSEASCRHR